jgi:predicted acyltransferase
MPTLTASAPVETPVTPNIIGRQRLVSVDALRGFDMFWIIGAESLVHALNRLGKSKPTALLAEQLSHAGWQGFHFYDLIFPLFLFLVGVSIVFSLGKAIAERGRSETLKRNVRRSILLFVVGIFCSGGLSSPWPDLRLMGVLNRIGISYLIAGILFCFFKPRSLAAICVGILLGYWALMASVPIRNIQLTPNSLARLAAGQGDVETARLFKDRDAGNPSARKNSPAWAAAEKLFYSTTERVSGKFDKGLNLSDHFDFQYLPGRKYDGYFDPEGFLSGIPAVATCLLGVLVGFLLKNPTIPDLRKVAILAGCGLAAVALGWLWNLQFPVVKKIWTSSFVLVAGGYSALLLSFFYLIVDVWQARAWCQPFIWMGMNSITIYVTAHVLVSFRRLAERFVGGDVKSLFDEHLARGTGDVVIAFVGLLLAFWFMRFLYQRKIFLRL